MPEPLYTRRPETRAWPAPWGDGADPVELEDLAIVGTVPATHLLPLSAVPSPPRGTAAPDPLLRDRLRRLHQRMTDAALGPDAFEEIAGLAAGAAGAPVAIAIPDVATVVAPAHALDPGERLTLATWVAERGRGRPVPARGDLIAEIPLVLRGEIVGLLALVDGRTEARRQASWVLEVTAAAVLTALAVEEARLDAERRLRGSFIEQLRSGDQLSRAEIVRRAQRLGCDLSRGALVICVDVEGNRPGLVVATIADEHPGAFAEAVGPFGGDALPQVWAVLPAVDAEAAGTATGQLAKRLATRLRPFGVVGISRFHGDPGELCRAIEEAQLMVKVLRRGGAPSGDQIVDGTFQLLFRLLSSHPDELSAYHVTTIGPLVQHDEQYRTDLVRTLEVYLDTDCNMNVTAETIFAHRHTVAHRLDRIQELTDLDAGRHEDRERLSLGLKIHRLMP